MRRSAWAICCLTCPGLLLAGCSTIAPFAKETPRAQPSTQPTNAQPQATDPGPQTLKGVYEFAASPEDLDRAIPEAMADLQMNYIRTRKDGAVRQIDAKTPDRRSVSVTIRPALDGKSRLSSRIGWFGDSVLSRALAERVGIRAGLLPPKPIPDQPPSSPDPNPLFSRSAVSDDEMFRDMADAQMRDRVVP